MKVKFIERIEIFGITAIKRIKPMCMKVICGFPVNCEEISEPHNPYYPIDKYRERTEEISSEDMWMYGRKYRYPLLEDIIQQKYKCLVEDILEINGEKYNLYH